MDDEDKIILAGLGTFGALTYIALKEIQERDALENGEDKNKITPEEKEPVLNEGFRKKIEMPKEIPIYKDFGKNIANLILGKR